MATKTGELPDDMKGACLVLMLFGIPFSILAGGWAVSILWAWFLVPLGLPPISWATAAGLKLLVYYCTYTPIYYGEDKRTETQKMGACIAGLYLGPFVYLASGWVLRFFL